MKKIISIIFVAMLFLSFTSFTACSCVGRRATRPPTRREMAIAQGENGFITISWDKIEGAATYSVYRANSRISDFMLLQEGIEGPTFTDASANRNRFRNYYRVVARNEEGQSFVTVSWNYVDDAEWYEVFLLDENGEEIFIAEREPQGELLYRQYYSFWLDDFDINNTEFRIVPNRVGGNVAADNWWAARNVTENRTWTNPEGNNSNAPFALAAPRMIDNWRNIPRALPHRSAYQGYNIVNRIDNPQLISFHSEMFGPHFIVFWEDDCTLQIEREVNRVGDAMRTHHNVAQFSRDRYSFNFMPGIYDFGTVSESATTEHSSLGVGFYMTISGLGLTPTDTHLNFPGNGTGTAGGHRSINRSGIHAHVALPLWNNAPHGTNVTHNFWRKAENFHISGLMEWSVSQAAPMRRIKVDGTTTYNYRSGWASGGFTADSYFNGVVIAGSQQQYYTRSSHFAHSSMVPTSWNTFTNASTGYAHPSNYATTGNAAWLNEGMEQFREKPFLVFNQNTHRYQVFVPALRQNAQGVSWTYYNPGVGTLIDLEDNFFIAREGDCIELINENLYYGNHLLLTPGIYQVDSPIFVDVEGAIVLGIGMATVGPNRGNIEGAVMVSDVSGVTIASLTIDAYYASKYQLRVGEVGSNRNHSANPTFIFDVFARVGGHYHHAVHTEVSVQINSNHVVGDHFWIWRADHGRGIRWDRNVGTFGLVVTGDDVTMHGLFVEHYQKHQAIWIGNRGRVFFVQCETPYEFPFQVYSHDGTIMGFSSIRVANSVTHFTGVGFGIYGVNNHHPKQIANAVEVPHRPNVWLRNVLTNEIGSRGPAPPPPPPLLPRAPFGPAPYLDFARTLNVVNGIGGATGNTGDLVRVVEFRDGFGTYRHFGRPGVHEAIAYNEPPCFDLDYLLQWVMQPCGAGLPLGWDPIWNMRPDWWGNPSHPDYMITRITPTGYNARSAMLSEANQVRAYGFSPVRLY